MDDRCGDDYLNRQGEQGKHNQIGYVYERPGPLCANETIHIQADEVPNLICLHRSRILFIIHGIWLKTCGG